MVKPIDRPEDLQALVKQIKRWLDTAKRATCIYDKKRFFMAQTYKERTMRLSSKHTKNYKYHLADIIGSIPSIHSIQCYFFIHDTVFKRRKKKKRKKTVKWIFSTEKLLQTKNFATAKRWWVLNDESARYFGVKRAGIYRRDIDIAQVDVVTLEVSIICQSAIKNISGSSGRGRGKRKVEREKKHLQKQKRKSAFFPFFFIFFFFFFFGQIRIYCFDT